MPFNALTLPFFVYICRPDCFRPVRAHLQMEHDGDLWLTLDSVRAPLSSSQIIPAHSAGGQISSSRQMSLCAHPLVHERALLQKSVCVASLADHPSPLSHTLFLPTCSLQFSPIFFNYISKKQVTRLLCRQAGVPRQAATRSAHCYPARGACRGEAAAAAGRHTADAAPPLA